MNITHNVQPRSLDGLVRFGAAAGILFIWTVFEKQIVEPFGLYHYMPFYRVEGICAWDILAMTAIATSFVVLGRRSAGTSR